MLLINDLWAWLKFNLNMFQDIPSLVMTTWYLWPIRIILEIILLEVNCVAALANGLYGQYCGKYTVQYSIVRMFGTRCLT